MPIKESGLTREQDISRLEPSKAQVYAGVDANKEISESESFLWYSVISKIRTEIENYQGTIYIPDLAPTV